MKKAENKHLFIHYTSARNAVMESAQQPKFNRMSLNVLMLVSVVLIVILGSTGPGAQQLSLPDAPNLNVNTWQSDSGASIWYNPQISTSIEMQFWYKAGYRYDQDLKGTAYLLAQLLKYESKQRSLDMKISLDQDFIKIGLSLNKDPSTLKKQISQASTLLYHPVLANSWLSQLRANQNSLTDQLRSQAYGTHPYAGPKQGDANTLSSITRKQLQNFHHQYLHPKRLSVSVVGDLDQATAQVISETLLPISKYLSASELQLKPQTSHQAQAADISVLVQPGIKELNTASHHMLSHVLNQQAPKQLSFQLGQLNSTLYVQGRSQLIGQLKQIEQGEFDWDMMLRAKRQIAHSWLKQLQGAQALSRYLVHLNAYDLPVNQMANNLNHLKEIDMDSWQQTSQKLLIALNH